MKNYKIILAHPGRQHSFRVAKALKESGHLFKYITTVYNKDVSIFMKLAKLLINKDNLIRAEKRKSKHIDDEDVILFNEFISYILLIVLRLDTSRKIFVWLNGLIKNSFGKKVARYAIKNNVDAVICYDTNARTCFEILEKQAPHIIRIIDHAAAPRNYLHKIFNDPNLENDIFKKTYKSFSYLLDKRYGDENNYELQVANFHIVASTFTTNGLLFNSISKDKIIFAPYGIELDKYILSSKKHNINLKLLYVGALDQRKGISQILNSAKRINDSNIVFNIVGNGFKSNPELFEPYRRYVNFHGYAMSHRMPFYYNNNDVFIFPSMGDGFGNVILEALASGLPVITTFNCAGTDLIIDGFNGFLIDAGDTNALNDRIIWFNNNKHKLAQMSVNARNTASKYSWEEYEHKLIQGLKKIF